MRYVILAGFVVNFLCHFPSSVMRRRTQDEIHYSRGTCSEFFVSLYIFMCMYLHAATSRIIGSVPWEDEVVNLPGDSRRWIAVAQEHKDSCTH